MESQQSLHDEIVKRRLAAIDFKTEYVASVNLNKTNERMLYDFQLYIDIFSQNVALLALVRFYNINFDDKSFRALQESLERETSRELEIIAEEMDKGHKARHKLGEF